MSESSEINFNQLDMFTLSNDMSRTDLTVEDKIHKLFGATEKFALEVQNDQRLKTLKLEGYPDRFPRFYYTQLEDRAMKILGELDISDVQADLIKLIYTKWIHDDRKSLAQIETEALIP